MEKNRPTGYKGIQIQRETSLKYQPRLEAAIINCISWYRGSLFLDVGFGAPSNLDLWKKEDVRGVDINPDVVRKTGDRAIEADAHELPFLDKSFDVIFSSHFLEHTYDPQKVIKEFERVAKKAIYIIVPLVEEVDTDPAHFSQFRSIHDVAKLFTWKPKLSFQRVHRDFAFIYENNT